MSAREIITHAKAFSSETTRKYRMLVDLDTKTISVWDNVARHYTTNHILRPGSIKRILKLAKGV